MNDEIFPFPHSLKDDNTCTSQEEAAIIQFAAKNPTLTILTAMTIYTGLAYAKNAIVLYKNAVIDRFKSLLVK